MANRILVRAACLLVALVSARAGAGETLKAGVFDPPRQAPDFTLPGSNGAPLKLADHRGKVVLLFFGFTNCPAVCPITTATLAAAHRQLGADAAREDKPDGTYQYGHSSFVYLVDPAGKLRALMPYGHPADDYVHDVRLLLAAP